LAAADLVVLPSLAFETQGMVVIEAMSCGTPAVASAVGGLPETLVAFPDHLVPPGDATALAGAIDRLVGWRQHTPALGNDSRQWVVSHLALDRTVEHVSTLLAGLRG
jgi:glycosyltransferase involved in cell wall biosynthesis